MKNFLEVFSSRLDTHEAQINELEDKAVEHMQTEKPNEKEFLKVKIP